MMRIATVCLVLAGCQGPVATPPGPTDLATAPGPPATAPLPPRVSLTPAPTPTQANLGRVVRVRLVAVSCTARVVVTTDAPAERVQVTLFKHVPITTTLAVETAGLTYQADFGSLPESSTYLAEAEATFAGGARDVAHSPAVVVTDCR